MKKRVFLSHIAKTVLFLYGAPVQADLWQKCRQLLAKKWRPNQQVALRGKPLNYLDADGLSVRGLFLGHLAARYPYGDRCIFLREEKLEYIGIGELQLRGLAGLENSPKTENTTDLNLRGKCLAYSLITSLGSLFHLGYVNDETQTAAKYGRDGYRELMRKTIQVTYGGHVVALSDQVKSVDQYLGSLGFNMTMSMEVGEAKEFLANFGVGIMVYGNKSKPVSHAVQVFAITEDEKMAAVVDSNSHIELVDLSEFDFKYFYLIKPT